MGNSTLTRADLAAAINSAIGLSRTDAAALVEMIIDEILDCLESGEDVKISSFGNFAIREKKARIGRNPKTGEEVTITPRRVLTFKPSQVLKKKVDAGRGGSS